MASNERYISTNADIKVSRSRFPMSRKTKHSYFHGYLQPVGSPIEVLPGDTLKAKISAFTRMSTPIVPFMDDVRQEIDVFFVPKRILNDKTKLFYGEAEGFGVARKVLEPRSNRIAMTEATAKSTWSNLQKAETFAGAFGAIINNPADSPVVGVYLNLLPIRAYLAVYNEYFRNENYQNPYKWNKAEEGDSTYYIASLGSTNIDGNSYIPVVNKDRDLITSILPWPIKGDPVTIPVNGVSPIVAKDGADFGLHNMGDNIKLGKYSSGAFYGANGYIIAPQSGNGVLEYDNDSIESAPTQRLNASNLYADLSSGVSVSVRDLLYSLAYEDFLARAAHFGTRFKEYIYSMFGCRIPDLTDDVPEYLGRLKFRINVQQVVQTTGFSPDDQTSLGALGAYSNSGKYDWLFTKSFTEPGYLVIVSYTKHQRTYSSGIDRVFIKHELLDYYQPPFANIPDIPFGSETLWLEANSKETSLGFQEPWWDSHVLIDRVYGQMNPAIDTLGEIWTLAEKWSTKPSIVGDFMKEDREAIARVLATGSDGPDYLCDFLLELDATRVMPLYSSGQLGKM